MHECHHSLSRLDGNAEDFAELLRCGGSAGYAQVGSRGTLRKRLGVAVAAGESAGAAVCARQAGADILLLLIDLHREEFCGDDQNERADKSDSDQYSDRNKDC